MGGCSRSLPLARSQVKPSRVGHDQVIEKPQPDDWSGERDCLGGTEVLGTRGEVAGWMVVSEGEGGTVIAENGVQDLTNR